MKKKMMMMACALLVFGLSLFAFGQEKNPVSAAVRALAQERGKHLVAAAEEMPADKYAFRPTPPQMTFGHLVMHTATANDFLCSKLGDVPAPQSDIKDTDAKDKLVAALKDSFEFCGKVLGKADDANLGDMLPFRGGEKASRAEIMIELTNDWADHYSAAAMYLRLNGLLPPTAKKK